MSLRTPWNVTVLVPDPAPPERDRKDLLDALLAALSDYSPAILYDEGYLGTPHLGTRLWVRAPDALTAAADAVAGWNAASRKVGLPERQPVRVSVVSEGDFRKDLGDETFPSLMGISEIARLLSVSRARASELARRATGFPRPVAQLASGPVWTEASVTAFAAQWARRPGRPRRGGEPMGIESIPAIQPFAPQPRQGFGPAT